MICIIPARSGSKSIPFKNIVSLNGKPLLAYTIEVAKQSRHIGSVYVSADHEKIKSVAEKYGAKIIDRSDCPEACNDDAHDRDVLVHAHLKQKNFSPIVYLRPTCPIRNDETIDDAIEYYMKNKDKCTSLKSVNKTTTVQKTFWKNGKYLNGYFDNLKPIFGEYYVKPRQWYNESYVGNSYVDILDPKIFMQENKCYGDKILFYETRPVPDIDTLDDLAYAEYLIRRQ